MPERKIGDAAENGKTLDATQQGYHFATDEMLVADEQNGLTSKVSRILDFTHVQRYLIGVGFKPTPMR